MKFKLRSTRNWYKKGETEKLEKLGFKFSLCEKGDYREGDLKKEDTKELSIEINTLDNLMDLIREYGSVVFVETDEIEIYDDYRE